MTDSMIRNLMIMHANATIRKSMAIQAGITAVAAQIARRDQPVRRGRWVQGGRQVRKVFPESEGRLARKAPKESQDRLAHRVPWVKQVLSVLRDLPV